MKARTQRFHLDIAAVTVVAILALGLGALSAASGFSPATALLVGSATGAFSLWAVSSKP